MPKLGRWRARSVIRAGVLFLIVLVLGGCLPQPRTDAGQDVASLYVLVLVLAVIVFVGVEGFIVYAIVRYRRRPGDDVLPEQHHGNTLVEIIWTAIPTVIVMVLFVMSVITLGSVEARSENPGETIRVEGFQWGWRFVYDDGTTIVGQGAEGVTMPVPAGEAVRLELESVDVNHAFYVPDFLIKRDLIKMGGEDGDPNVLEFTVTEPGTYSGQCAEFCGVGHAEMVFTVDAMTRENFDAYLADVAAGETPEPPSAGECEVTVSLVAQNTAFDKNELEVPADTPFCIEFENRDENIPHNVSIRDGDEAPLEGEFLNTVGTITYSVPALAAGEYDFVCDAHVQAMNGTLTVTP